MIVKLCELALNLRYHNVRDLSCMNADGMKFILKLNYLPFSLGYMHGEYD